MLDLDKTPGHYHAMIEVAKRPGITISELGRLLLMSVSTISRVVKFLGKEKLISFKPGEDKREKSLFLTKRGLEEVQKIDVFSDAKIIDAFEFLTEGEIMQIIQSISMYEQALEKSRVVRDSVKIVTLPTSRTIRRQIVNMVSTIQKKEFLIPITSEVNAGILHAEKEYYFNNSYNFWYAVNDEGKIVGSIGLKRVNGQCGEVKKFFVIKEYRGKGVAQKLMNALLKAAIKHQFTSLVLGTTDKFFAAHKFYEKFGFTRIAKSDLPEEFELNSFDSFFYLKSI